MNSDQVIEITKSALVISSKLALPFLLSVLIVGLIVGLVQSLTQLQESTLSFVPKLLACALVLALAGNWMILELVNFTRELWTNANQFIGR
jgi:flagellar biosynthetic protein FliQ